MYTTYQLVYVSRFFTSRASLLFLTEGHRVRDRTRNVTNKKNKESLLHNVVLYIYIEGFWAGNDLSMGHAELCLDAAKAQAGIFYIVRGQACLHYTSYDSCNRIFCAGCKSSHFGEDAQPVDHGDYKAFDQCLGVEDAINHGRFLSNTGRFTREGDKIEKLLVRDIPCEYTRADGSTCATVGTDPNSQNQMWPLSDHHVEICLCTP